jgi:hypothetical protein
MLVGMPTEIGDVTGLCGAILGAAGFTLSLVNARRDRSKLRIRLTFNNVQFAYGVRGSDDQLWVAVHIANTGRRPVFVSHVGIVPASRWTRRRDRRKLLIFGSEGGHRVQEGDAPWIVPGKQDEAVIAFVRRYGSVRAFVLDAEARTLLSPPVTSAELDAPAPLTVEGGDGSAPKMIGGNAADDRQQTR